MFWDSVIQIGGTVVSTGAALVAIYSYRKVRGLNRALARDKIPTSPTLPEARGERLRSVFDRDGVKVWTGEIAGQGTAINIYASDSGFRSAVLTEEQIAFLFRLQPDPPRAITSSSGESIEVQHLAGGDFALTAYGAAPESIVRVHLTPEQVKFLFARTDHKEAV